MGRKGAYEEDPKSMIHALMVCDVGAELSFVLEQCESPINGCLREVLVRSQSTNNESALWFVTECLWPG